MDSEELKEFERAIVAGEINDYNTNFEAYFEQVDDEDKISAMRKICIENNVYKKAYPDWADEFIFTDDLDMQYLLLDADQCLDILISSNKNQIRREVVEKDIKYAFEDHVMEYDQDIIIDILMREIEPNAHKKLWKRFTDDLLVYLTKVNPDVLYIMWGGNAKEHGQRIEQELNCNDNILYSSHPSPLSARHSFFGSKPFTWANESLKRQEKAPITWA